MPNSKSQKLISKIGRKSFFSGSSVEVLLPLPSKAKYDYLVANQVELMQGDFVNVPLGRRSIIGVVWGAGRSNIDCSSLKLIHEKLDCHGLKVEYCEFISWVAKYTLNSLGLVLKMAMSVPKALDPPAEKTVFLLEDKVININITPARQRVLNVLSDGTPRSGAELARKANCASSVIIKLAALNVLTAIKAKVASSFERPEYLGRGPVLNEEQSRAAKALEKLITNGFSVTLLDGVPGAGKTEVYFQAVCQALKNGLQVLVLLPEIALSAQWTDRFLDRFGCHPAQWHSDLSHALRRDTWRAVSDGAALIVVGARSALFLPFKNLGLIIVDEEHETSFKQEDGVIYNARDMAIVRAKHEKIPSILVSATPSLETLMNVKRGRYGSQRLSVRHANASLPSVEVIDMRRESPPRGRWLSPILEENLQETFSSGKQAMLYINRRGYAPLTICQSCGYRFHCPNCIAWLVEHRSVGQLHCHHCGYQAKMPTTCPSCSSDKAFAACGPGVERLAEEVQKIFPSINLVIAASDTITGPKAATELIRKIEAHEVDLVIGTQIIAKGYHFALMTLVGIIDADLGLSGGDLRAAERTYQLLYQVSGRAGREKYPGKVILQTYMPEHPVMRALINGSREDFMNAEAEARRSTGMPPFGRLVSIIISGFDENTVDLIASSLGVSAPLGEEIKVFGPTPAPLSILRGRHRRRLLLIASREVVVQPIIEAWMNKVKIPQKVRVQIDVDPYSFL